MLKDIVAVFYWLNFAADVKPLSKVNYMSLRGTGDSPLVPAGLPLMVLSLLGLPVALEAPE